jgi:hypothetical protein
MFQFPASRRVFPLLQSIQNSSEAPQSHTQWVLQTLLTHCGLVTQIYVFTLQLCRTSDVDLRF